MLTAALCALLLSGCQAAGSSSDDGSFDSGVKTVQAWGELMGLPMRSTDMDERRIAVDSCNALADDAGLGAQIKEVGLGTGTASSWDREQFRAGCFNGANLYMPKAE